jgi:hypothetical protein
VTWQENRNGGVLVTEYEVQSGNSREEKSWKIHGRDGRIILISIVINKLPTELSGLSLSGLG